MTFIVAIELEQKSIYDEHKNTDAETTRHAEYEPKGMKLDVITSRTYVDEQTQQYKVQRISVLVLVVGVGFSRRRHMFCCRRLTSV